jgi:hypothetical protein
MDFQELERIILLESEARGERLYRVVVSFPDDAVFMARAALSALTRLETVAAVVAVIPLPEAHPESSRSLVAFCSSALAGPELQARIVREAGIEASCEGVDFEDFAAERQRAQEGFERSASNTVFAPSGQASSPRSVLHTLIFDYKALICDLVSLLSSVSAAERRVPSSSRFERALMGLSSDRTRLVEFTVEGKEWAIPDCAVESFVDLEEARFMRGRGEWLYGTSNGEYPVFGSGSEPEWASVLQASSEAAGILVDYAGKKTLVLAEKLERRTTAVLPSFQFLSKRGGAAYSVSYGQGERTLLLPSAL